MPLLMLTKIQAHYRILQSVLQSGFAAKIKFNCHPDYAKQYMNETTMKLQQKLN